METVRAAIRAPFSVLKITEEEERRIREERDAAELALQRAAAGLAVFPLLEVSEYEAALAALRQATDAIVEPPAEEAPEPARSTAGVEVESLAGDLAPEGEQPAAAEEAPAAEGAAPDETAAPEPQAETEAA